VLVVDDRRPFRSAAKAVVEMTDGFACAGEAEDGEAAIELARALRPSLVLMDVNLPGVSGCEAAREIRAEFPRTVVFLMSTYDSVDIPVSPSDCGASVYFRKEEFGPAELRAMWDRFVPPKAA
jgi:DNA-binding NarL/FixJ family response regulator